MLKCWSYRPEDRPSFGYCLEVLTALKYNTSDATHIISQNKSRMHNGKRKTLIFRLIGS